MRFWERKRSFVCVLGDIRSAMQTQTVGDRGPWFGWEAMPGTVAWDFFSWEEGKE